MINYRRDYSAGALYFFTLTLHDRQSTYLLHYIDLLGKAFRYVRFNYPFTTHAMVVLPEHLHVIWELPEDDYNYSQRWRLIKTRFTQELVKKQVPISKNNRGEYNLWQKRFWEHRIRDENDLERHVDYIHINPVKHGYVSKPEDWLYSSIHRHIARGLIIKNIKTREYWGFGE